MITSKLKLKYSANIEGQTRLNVWASTKMVEQTNLVSFWSKQHTMGTDQRLTRDDLVP